MLNEAKSRLIGKNTNRTNLKTGKKLILFITLLIVNCTLNIENCVSQVWVPFANGLDGKIYATTVFNNELIVAGSFNTAGGITVNGIAKWNGSSWSALGSGVDGTYHNIYALAVYNGELIAGGEFTIAGGISASMIAKWNGTSWSSLGSGLTNGTLKSVYCLYVFNNELIAGGDFLYAGGNLSPFIAKWNGTSWSTMSGLTGRVYALSSFNGELVAGGDFTSSNFSRIAKWNGSTWSGLGSSGANSSVNAFVIYGSDLIVAGNFTTIGGISAQKIAKWNGTSWSALGLGIGGVTSPIVSTLSVLNNDLIAGGTFLSAGNYSASNIAKWNGTDWSAMGNGMNNSVYSLLNRNGELIAGGSFTMVGGIYADYLAHWGNYVIHDIITGPFFDLPGQTTINTQVPVKVKIFNNGTVTESNVPVRFYVNGTLTNTTNKNLYSAQTDSVINVWTPSATGIYNLMYITSLPQDTNRFNDTVKTVINVLPNLSNACIGADTLSSTYPFTTYYKNSRTKILFRVSELQAAGLTAGKYITKIGFDVKSYSNQVMNGFNVRLKHTFDTAVIWTDSLNWTTVFSGSYAVGGTGLQYIYFTAPFFQYNGTSNLLLEICYSNTNYTTNTQVKATTKQNYFTRGYSSDNGSGCYLSSYGGLSARPNICFGYSTLTGTENYSNSIPEKYSLSQNYPNPFNPTTNIKYQIPINSFVTLKIYDVMGREVKTLVSETKSAGSYSVDFNASDFSSGVYFYKIQSGDFTETKKMLLIK